MKSDEAVPKKEFPAVLYVTFERTIMTDYHPVAYTELHDAAEHGKVNDFAEYRLVRTGKVRTLVEEVE